jgi:hypothetical protein
MGCSVVDHRRTQIEVTRVEPVAGVATADVGEGALLLSVVATAKHLGVTRPPRTS